jgi:hypothetical protein
MKPPFACLSVPSPSKIETLAGEPHCTRHRKAPRFLQQKQTKGKTRNIIVGCPKEQSYSIIRRSDVSRLETKVSFEKKACRRRPTSVRSICFLWSSWLFKHLGSNLSDLSPTGNRCPSTRRSQNGDICGQLGELEQQHPSRLYYVTYRFSNHNHGLYYWFHSKAMVFSFSVPFK